MTRKKYMKLASRRFLEGTRFKAPIDAVEAGVRTLEQWADVLTQEREAQSALLYELAQSKMTGTIQPKNRKNLP